MRKFIKKAQPRREEEQPALRQHVSAILHAVKTEGEAAVRRYSQQFDSWNPPSFRVSAEEIARAEREVAPSLKEDILFSQEQVRKFARLQLESLREFEAETLPGVKLGQKHIPVGSAGAYVPVARYPLVSSATMCVVTAKAAGVARVVACSPPRGGKRLDPAVLFALRSAGADEIYSIGGPQALAAMAYGIQGLKPVDVIVGPGSPYVTEAKRQLFGDVGIDLLAGPSEVLIIADEFADPELVAADLLAQAEHAPDARVVLVSLCMSLPRRVMEELESRLKDLPSAEVARQAWEQNGEVIYVDSSEEAASLADEYAPEHVQVNTVEPQWFLERLRNYGSLFLGEAAAVVYSDFAIGTNHILPVQGAARYTGGLWVGHFLKTVTYQRLTNEASAEIAPRAARLAELEGLPGHKSAADARRRKYTE